MSHFTFQDCGIGDLIRKGRLTVPPNQRSYAWKDTHVTDLLQDLNAAIQEGDQEEYFLGTIVLVNSGSGPPEIADGQQRIATTSIIMARARDLLEELGETQRAAAINEQYIQRIDLDTADTVPHLQMNDEDNQYFRSIVISPLIESKDIVAATKAALRASNKRLLAASECALDFLRKILATFPAHLQADQIVRWVKFLKERASVVIVTVPDEVGAYRIFETLNDRGLKASQADILKNYLFSKTTAQRVQEAHAQWNAMSGTISSLPEEEDDNLVNYIRHFWIVKDGLTRHKELAKSIKSKVNNELKSMQLLTEARNASVDYISLWMPTSAKWGKYRSTTRQYLHTLFSHLKVEQIIPLVFAVSAYFNEDETDKAFKLFVSWSVRFLLSGSRGGRLEKPYADAAHAVGNGKITKARELRDFMRHLVPTDKEFEESFAVARVSKAFLARYYLRAIDKAMKGDPTPEYVANEDEKEINLEHVMPLVTGKGWNVDEDEADAAQKMLGNMVLLSAKKNVQLGNSDFDEKKRIFRESSYLVTNQVADYDKWGLEQIRARQASLATFAARTWPTDFKRE
jgi:CMP-N-acetylneuraminic acid synthetase